MVPSPSIARWNGASGIVRLERLPWSDEGRNDLDAAQRGEQVPHLVLRRRHPFGRAGQAELTQAVAAHLESDFAGEIAVDPGDLDDVGQVLAKLESVVTQVCKARLVGR